jgi:hypothetical protein
MVAFTYDQWERLPIGMKEMYVAGAIDWLSTVTVAPAAGTGKYYNDCLAKKGITVHEFAELMKEVVQTRLDLRPKPASGAILATLIKMCGTPVPEWPK